MGRRFTSHKIQNISESKTRSVGGCVPTRSVGTILLRLNAETHAWEDQALHQWPAIVSRIDQQLRHQTGDFLFGEPSIADFSLAHPLWFLKGSSVTSPLVDAYPTVAAWLDRVLRIGSGTSTHKAVNAH